MHIFIAQGANKTQLKCDHSLITLCPPQHSVRPLQINTPLILNKMQKKKKKEHTKDKEEICFSSAARFLFSAYMKAALTKSQQKLINARTYCSTVIL